MLCFYIADEFLLKKVTKFNKYSSLMQLSFSFANSIIVLVE